MTESEQQKLIAAAHQKLDQIIEIYTTSKFIEVSGLKGGEYFTFRFYPNGLIVEK
jgi:hypothetical protein